MKTPLKPPFPYFGGKSKVADRVWDALGDVKNYVEPFAGSLAVLLARPHEPKIETVNDKDGMISNFWRAVQSEQEEVARWADWPVNENDLHARHAWLVEQKGNLQEQLEGDKDFYDSKIAGYWVWGMACWIGSGFCSGNGRWVLKDGRLVDGDAGRGIKRQRPHLGGAGQGINRNLPHLGDAGQGINRLGNAGWGELIDYFETLAHRLRHVRVCSGDWSRVCGPTVTFTRGLTGVFLDPPYVQAGRCKVYDHESASAAEESAAWAIEAGKNPLMRVVYCGYEGGPEFPADWRIEQWKAGGGYGNQGDAQGRENAHRERIWYSPACLNFEPELALDFGE